MLQILGLLFAATFAAQTATDLQVKGTFVEPVSKIAFPEHVGEWTRRAVTEYPWPGGYSVSYRLTEQDITLADVTGYVYPHVDALMPARRGEHFTFTLKTLLGANPTWQVLETTHESVLGRRGPVVRSAALLRTGMMMDGSPEADALYLQQEDGFWIKWRSTMPSATMDAVVPRVRALFDALIAPRTGD